MEMKLYIKINQMLLELGMSTRLKGYLYLQAAFYMAIENRGILNEVKKELYPGIAKIYNTTDKEVEKAIQSAIEYVWDKGNFDMIHEVFGYTIQAELEKPTHSKFIALLLDQICLDEMRKER